MMNGSTALAEKFYAEFQTRCQAIGLALDQQRDDFVGGKQQARRDVSFNKCLADIAELQRNVRDATVYTNNHDQRVYANSIKALQNKVEALKSLAKPKGKFSFKSARKPTANGESQPAAVKTGSTQARELVSEDSVDRSADFKGDNLINESLQATIRQKIQVSKTALQKATNPSVQRASECIIDLASQQSEPFSGLHVVDVKHSIVLCGSTSGGLHITDVHSSVLIAATHQFRMHRCSDVTVYLASGSSPIIEDCTSIRFAPLALGADSKLNMPKNLWESVLDFQYPGLTGPTPNWSEVTEEKRVPVRVDGVDELLPDSSTPRQLGDLHSLLVSLGVRKDWRDDHSDVDEVTLLESSVR